MDNHTALHLEAQQTIASEDKTLLDIYADTLSSRSEQLKEISDTIVVDGYFSKEPFVRKMKEAGLKVVSRFRDDARLQYILPPVKTGKKGRPKTNGGKVDKEHLNMDFFSLVEQENADFLIYIFSMKNIKINHHNALLLERFFSMFAINPNLLKNSQNVKELLLYGTLYA